MKKRISTGAHISHFTVGINIITGLLYTPWMIRMIGNNSYALYSLALSVINIFMLDFGLSSATSRFLSKYYANEENKLANGFLGITLKLYLGIDIIIFVVLGVIYFLIDQIYVQLTAEEIHTFKVIYIIVAFYSIVSFPLLNMNGVLIAKEKFISVKLCSLFQKLLTVFLVVSVLMIGGKVYALVLANAGVGIFFSAIKLLLVKRSGVRFDLHYQSREVWKELITFSLWTTVVQFMQRFFFSLAPTLLAVYFNSMEISYFSLASTIEGYVWIIGDAINGMFMPQIARLNNEENAEEKITDLMCKVGRFQIIVIGLIVVVFGLVGKDFVAIWIGAGYEKVSLCAILIIFPLLLDIPQQIGKTTMMIRNMMKVQGILYLGSVIVYIPIAMGLAKTYGAIGISVAIFLVYLIRNIVMSMIYCIKLRLNVKRFYKSVYGRWIFVAFFSIIASLILRNFIRLDNVIIFLIETGICCAMYCVAVWLIYFTREEKNIFLSKIVLKQK